MQKNSDFPTLEIYYSNYANLKIKAIHNVCFQKPCIVTFDNYKYVSTSKSYKLQSHNITSCKKTSFPLVHFTIPCQNIQFTGVPCRSATCSAVGSKRVNSDVYAIYKNAVNVVRDSVIARVSPRLSSSLELHSVTVTVLDALNEWLVKLLVFVWIAIVQIVNTLEVAEKTMRQTLNGFFSDKDLAASSYLQPRTKYLRKTLVFMWNSVLRENLISIFNESVASIDNIFFLGGTLGTRL